MGDHRAVVIGHEIVDADDLSGSVLAALMVRVNRDYPALLRINPSLVSVVQRPAVHRWAGSELQKGEELSILCAGDLASLAP